MLPGTGVGSGSKAGPETVPVGAQDVSFADLHQEVGGGRAYRTEPDLESVRAGLADREPLPQHKVPRPTLAEAQKRILALGQQAVGRGSVLVRGRPEKGTWKGTLAHAESSDGRVGGDLLHHARPVAQSALEIRHRVGKPGLDEGSTEDWQGQRQGEEAREPC